MEKVATVWHHSIVPLIGPKAFQHDTSNITTSCELYVSNVKKIAAFQLRSPLVAATMNEFFNELIDFLKSNKIAKLILLTSSYAYEQHFIGGNPFAVIVDDAFRGVETDAIQRMKWNEFQGDIIHGKYSYRSCVQYLRINFLYLQGGGYVKQFMSVASRNGIPTLTLFKYVSEGDNSVDAVTLLEELNAGFNIIEQTGDGKLNIILPVSWKSLFGNPIPEQLY